MAKYEVSVREYQHITVEADSPEEAKKRAKKKSGYDMPEVYQPPIKLSDGPLNLDE